MMTGRGSLYVFDVQAIYDYAEDDSYDLGAIKKALEAYDIHSIYSGHFVCAKNQITNVKDVLRSHAPFAQEPNYEGEPVRIEKAMSDTSWDPIFLHDYFEYGVDGNDFWEKYAKLLSERRLEYLVDCDKKSFLASLKSEVFEILYLKQLRERISEVEQKIKEKAYYVFEV